MTVYVVLGGGLENNGCLPAHVRERVHFVLENMKDGDAVILSALFSLNIPPIFGESSFPMSEALEMKKYFLAQQSGVECKLYLENASFDTIGAAFFLRNIFGFLLKNKKMIIVTSDFHVTRTEAIFRKVWQLKPQIIGADFEFIGLRTDFVKFRTRYTKEAQSVEKFAKTTANLKSMNQFSEWFYSEHDNYSDFVSAIIYQRGSQNDFNY